MKPILVCMALAIVVMAPQVTIPVQKAPIGIPVREGPISVPVIRPTGPGQVDWSYQAIQAKGMSVIDTALPLAQAKAMAIRGAKLDAQRNLLETIKGVRIVSETRVNDLMTLSDYVYSRVEGVVKGAVMVGEPREAGDGKIEVVMEIPLYGKAGIAPPLVDEIMKLKPPREPRGMIPAKDRETVEALSSVVFDLSGTGIEPQMFPALLDSSGNVLLDMIQYYQAGAEAFEKLRYVKSIEDVLRDPELRSNPLVIKVIEATEKGWVVAQKDVKKVSWLEKGFDILLKLGKVVMMFL